MTLMNESEQTNAARLRELNATVRYTMWSVFRAATPLGLALRDELTGRSTDCSDRLAAKDVVVRGTYDVSALRADADLMVWACRLVGRAAGGLRVAAPHQARHAPGAGLVGDGAAPPGRVQQEPCRRSSPVRRPAYVCVYPFVRSYEWYLLPDEERRELLAEHGRMARGYPDVRANTVSSFALGDYEWILAFESDELHRIVDLMRDLRASGARRHVRDEIPFYTGRRRPVAEIVAWSAMAVGSARTASRPARRGRRPHRPARSPSRDRPRR